MTRLTPLLLLIAMGLAACETTAGLGRDVEDAGEFITEEAQEADAAL